MQVTGLPRHIVPPWPADWPPQIGDFLPPPFPRFTRAFHRLYGRITSMIRRAETSWGASPEVAFFEFLIAGFYREYEAWILSRPIREHLENVNDLAHTAAVNLMAQAYLHMAYDLPRVIADALRTGILPPSIARSRFLSFESGFEEEADAVAGDFKTLGTMSVVNKLAPRAWKLSYVFAVWVLRIRSNAYLAAEILADPVPPRSRAAYEADMLREIIRRQDQVLADSPFSLLSFRGLGTPAMALVPLLLLVERPMAIVFAIVGVLLVLLAVWGGVTYLAIHGVIDRLGAETLRAMRSAFAGEIGESSPGESRQLVP